MTKNSLKQNIAFILGLLFCLTFLTGCPFGEASKEAEGTRGEEGDKGRFVYFIGMDISGSFMRSSNYKDSLKFMAHYIFTHLHGHGGLDIPGSLFVGTIGGVRPGEPKTFYPIQTFQHRSIGEIERKLIEIFPSKKENPFTDYNAFFEQVAVFVRNKKLVLKPITIVLITDGIPDAKVTGKEKYRTIKLKSLENLARDITLRVLYTNAVVGMNWQTLIPRQRVKVWTQDYVVMRDWKDPHILLPKTPFEKQTRFFSWLKDNVDFNVPRKRVD